MNQPSSTIKRRLGASCLLPLILAILSQSVIATESERPMQKLNWLLGKWTFEDAQVNGSYWERGSRNCVLILDEQYIRCESKGLSHKGHARSYHFILGYNSMDQRYEMLGLTSSYPRQNLYIINLSRDGYTLELTNHFWTADGLIEANEATIQYNGVDQYIWHIRNGKPNPVSGQKSVGFIDTVTRVK